MARNLYGDISPRTAAFVSQDLLERAIPYMVTEMFGQGRPIPSNSTKSAVFRRYEALDNTPNYLAEGVTPSGKPLRKTDITATLVQLGDLIEITDVVADTHEDPVMQEATDLCSEQSAQMIERMRLGVLRSGTNVMFANGSSRAAVNTEITSGLIRRTVRALERQNCRKVSRAIRPTPDYGIVALPPSYFAFAHSDLDADLRAIANFRDPANYASMTPYEHEMGSVEKVRFLSTTLLDPWVSAGGAPSTTYLSGNGSNCDVYPVIVVGMNAYGIVPFKGMGAVTPTVVNPTPSGADPLGQRGFVGWKAMQTAVILNDLWMCRMEVAVRA
jgi:N4-gp56 family major capsid protein